MPTNDFAFAFANPPQGFIEIGPAPAAAILAPVVRMVPQPLNSYTLPNGVVISGYTGPLIPTTNPPFRAGTNGNLSQNRLIGGVVYLAIVNALGADLGQPNNSQTIWYKAIQNPQPFTPGGVPPPPGSFAWSVAANSWQVAAFKDLSITTSNLTPLTPYDLFFDGTGSTKIIAIAWTNATTRATPLNFIRGRPCATNPTNNQPVLYLGSIFTDGSGFVHDNNFNRLVYDHYESQINGLGRRSRADNNFDNTASWAPTVTGSTFQPMKNEIPAIGDGSGRWTYNVMMGVGVPMNFWAGCFADTNAKIAIAIDSTSAVDATFSSTGTSTGMNQKIEASASGMIFGFHTIRVMQSAVSGTPNFYGATAASLIIPGQPGAIDMRTAYRLCNLSGFVCVR